MAITIQNTNYNGEVLEQILTKAALSNELVNEGLIHIEPGIQKKWTLPMLSAHGLLQKRVEMPSSANSTGDVVYKEKSLVPVDFMAYLEFNPRTFESIWRPFQPTGNLVFRELAPNVQLTLVNALLDQVAEEMGDNYINGTYNANTGLFNGIVSHIVGDSSTVVVAGGQTTYAAKLKAIFAAVPKSIRKKSNLKFIMNMDDADAYDYELKEKTYKNADLTKTQTLAYNGIPIVSLANWPKGLIVCTIASTGFDGMFYGAVDYNNDDEIFQIERLAANGEKYFFKMLMKADTNTAWNEYIVMMDERETGTATLSSNAIVADGIVSKLSVTSLAANATYTLPTSADLGTTIVVENATTGSYTVTIGDTSLAKGKSATFKFNGTAWF